MKILNTINHGLSELVIGLNYNLLKSKRFIFLVLLLSVSLFHIDKFNRIMDINILDIISSLKVDNKIKLLPFGEPFYKIKPVQFYEYKGVKSKFSSVKLKPISTYSKKEFEGLVLSSLRPFLSKRLKPLIAHTLDLSMKYSIDPFWALAIMGTESHYKISAKSYAHAYGPMQIMPGTAYFISKLLKKTKNYEKSLELRSNFKENIEMGVFYLGYLLKTFDGSHRLATTAYNMGPNGVRRRLRNHQEVGVRNNYLDKVRVFYKILTRTYLKDQNLKKLIKMQPLRHLSFPFQNLGTTKTLSYFQK